MKRFAINVLLAAALISAPAMASTGFVEGKRMNSYYGASERDQVNKETIKLSRQDVKNIQISLRKEGYKPGKIDGIYGWQTRAAVKAFQKDRNLRGNGKMTALTLGELRVSVALDFDHKLDRNYN